MMITLAGIRNCFLPLFISCCVLCSRSATAQPGWEPINNGIWGADVHDITFTAAGSPLITTGHGLYRGEKLSGNGPEVWEWRRLEKKMVRGDLASSPDGRIFINPYSAVSTYSGLYFSDDSGTTWQQYTSHVFTSYTVLDGNSVVGLRSKNGMTEAVIGSDGGREWRSYPISRTNTPLVLLHDSSWNLYAYTPNSGFGTPTMFGWSFDTGKTWTELIIPYTIRQFEVVGPGELLAVVPDGIYASVDTGHTWTMVDTIRVDQLAGGEGGKLYARRHLTAIETGTYPGILSSTDKGRSWYPVSSHSSTRFALSPEGDLWSVSRRFVHHSTDQGRTWEPQSFGLTNTSVETVLFDHESSTLYALVERESRYGNLRASTGDPMTFTLYSSSDKGESWSVIADSVREVLLLDSLGGVYVVRDSLYYQTLFDDQMREISTGIAAEQFLYRSSDRGISWQRLPGSSSKLITENSYPLVVSNNRGVIVVNLPVAQNQRVTGYRQFLSADAGKTWKVPYIPEPIPDSSVIGMIYISDQNDLFLICSFYPSGSAPALPRSNLWRVSLNEEILDLMEPVPVVDTVETILFYADHEGRMYRSGRTFSRFYVSSDRGNTWETIFSSSEERSSIFSFHATADGSLFIQNVQVHRSEDRGRNWDTIEYAFPLASRRKGCLVSLRHHDTYNPEFDWEIYHRYSLIWSNDNGDNWQPAEGIMEHKWVTSAVFDELSSIIAGTAMDGLFRSGLVSGVPESEERIPSHHLQFYPSPTTDRATISLALTRAGTVRLGIYDQLGRLVQGVADQDLHAGNHRFDVDLESFPAGSYFCRLAVGDEIETIPVLVR